MLLVTGSTGQVGDELIKSLIKKKINHLCISRKVGPTAKNSRKISLDLTIQNLDWKNLEKEVTSIVHLAAAVPHSNEYPDTYESANKTQAMDDNIINLQNATKAPLVYFSTCGLYSKSVDYFHKENSSERLIPRSPYFEAKMRGELKFRQISNSVVFRLSAPVSTSLKPHLVLGRMIHSARNQGSISVYGSGMREQDFILTGDINSAVMKSLSNEIYGTYNLCSSRPVTMLSLAETVAKHIKGVEIRVGEKEDINEGDRARYDNSRLRNSIDWNPTSSMSEIIKRIMY